MSNRLRVDAEPQPALNRDPLQLERRSSGRLDFRRERTAEEEGQIGRPDHRRDAGRVRPADLPIHPARERDGRQGRPVGAGRGVGRWDDACRAPRRPGGTRRGPRRDRSGDRGPSPVGAGRRGRRGPGRRRASRLVGGRWSRAAQDVPRRAARLGVIPDGALRGPGPRCGVHVRRRGPAPPGDDGAARDPWHGPRPPLARHRRLHDRDRSRAGLAVRAAASSSASS